MAIQEARIALAHRSDDTRPYRILSEAYRLLMIQESALLAGIKLSPENVGAILQVEPRTNLLMNRFRQRATALNAAIQTTPVPASEPERQQLFTLNFQLFQLYLSVNYLDLARDRLQALLAYPPEQLDPEMLSGLTQQLASLNQQVKEILDDLNDRTIEQQLGPLQRRLRAQPGRSGARARGAGRGRAHRGQPGHCPAATDRPLRRHRPAREGPGPDQHRQHRGRVARERARRRRRASGPRQLPARLL